MKKTDQRVAYSDVHAGIVLLLEAARRATVRHVNVVMTVTYWEIGRRIVEFEQGGEERAVYGQALIRRLAKDLVSRFGRGFGAVNLGQMRRFYLAWPAAENLSAQSGAPSVEIVQTLSEQSPELDLVGFSHRFPLPWSAYVRLLSVKNGNARAFYETQALQGGWSVRQLDRQIESQFYERTILSRNKATMLRTGELTQPNDIVTPEQAIKDPYVLEFLDLKDEYSENELEEALIHRLEDFLLELGDDFAFVGRQRRLRVGDTWFRVDLVFFHRRLRCLVIIDLKSGKFSYADAGQMHLYLNYAKEHWVREGENPPVGLILCAEKDAAEAHYALEGMPNKVLAAEYRTVLPNEQELALELSRAREAIKATCPQPMRGDD